MNCAPVHPVLALRALALTAALIAISGCGNSANLPPGDTGTVKGKVTYKGKPVPAGCTVTFMRNPGGITAIGTTDASGEYLLSMRNGLKILCGTYRVCILPPNPSSGMSDEEVMKLSMAGKLPDTVNMKEVPDKYRNPETTKVVFEVVAGANVADIDMTD